MRVERCNCYVMLQNAFQWLHEFCMGLVLGRNPGHETLRRSERNRFLLCVLQGVVVHACVVLLVS